MKFSGTFKELSKLLKALAYQRVTLTCNDLLNLLNIHASSDITFLDIQFDSESSDAHSLHDSRSQILQELSDAKETTRQMKKMFLSYFGHYDFSRPHNVFRQEWASKFIQEFGETFGSKTVLSSQSLRNWKSHFHFK